MAKKNTEIIIAKSAISITKWVGSITSIIVHTVLFLISFILPILGFVNLQNTLLFVTTLVSLEAIYLSIFIQMSLNLNNENIVHLQEDVEEIVENIEEIQEEIYDDNEDEGNELIEELTILSKKIGGLSPKARQIIINRIQELKSKK
jgi:low affinity Fe/Cu permease